MPRTIEVEEQDAALLCEAAETLFAHAYFVPNGSTADAVMAAIARVRAAMAPKTMGDPDDEP